MRIATILSIALLCGSLTHELHAQVGHDLVATDFEFTPSLLTISSGDTVRLFLNAGHSFREVSAATWNLDVADPGAGGEFSPTDSLVEHDFVVTTPGTIYYVCIAHVSMGMKGRIIVQQGTIGMEEQGSEAGRIFPDPASDVVHIADDPRIMRVRVADALGRVLIDRNMVGYRQLDVTRLPPGRYELILLGRHDAVLQRQSIIVQR